MNSDCTPINNALRKAQVIVLSFSVLTIIILCSICWEWAQASKKWHQKWQSEIMHTRIEQTEDIVEVRKLAEYCRRSVDSTFSTLAGINKANLILMIGWVGQLLLISMCLRRVSRYIDNTVAD